MFPSEALTCTFSVAIGEGQSERCGCMDTSSQLASLEAIGFAWMIYLGVILGPSEGTKTLFDKSIESIHWLQLHLVLLETEIKTAYSGLHIVKRL